MLVAIVIYSFFCSVAAVHVRAARTVTAVHVRAALITTSTRTTSVVNYLIFSYLVITDDIIITILLNSLVSRLNNIFFINQQLGLIGKKKALVS